MISVKNIKNLFFTLMGFVYFAYFTILFCVSLHFSIKVAFFLKKKIEDKRGLPQI